MKDHSACGRKFVIILVPLPLTDNKIGQKEKRELDKNKLLGPFAKSENFAKNASFLCIFNRPKTRMMERI